MTLDEASETLAAEKEIKKGLIELFDKKGIILDDNHWQGYLAACGDPDVDDLSVKIIWELERRPDGKIECRLSCPEEYREEVQPEWHVLNDNLGPHKEIGVL